MIFVIYIYNTFICFLKISSRYHLSDIQYPMYFCVGVSLNIHSMEDVHKQIINNSGVHAKTFIKTPWRVHSKNSSTNREWCTVKKFITNPWRVYQKSIMAHSQKTHQNYGRCSYKLSTLNKFRGGCALKIIKMLFLKFKNGVDMIKDNDVLRVMKIG